MGRYLEKDNDTMKRTRRSVLLSQEGKLEIVIIGALIVGMITWIIGKFTGYKVFVFTLSSGILRLSIGLFSALFLYVWWGMNFHEQFSVGEFGEWIVVFSLLTCTILSFVLIPLGLIQVFGSIITKKKKLNEQ
jgi:hypothetical protein